MIQLPDANRGLLLRTDYSDEAAWTELCRLVEAPYEDDFQASLTFVDNPLLADRTFDDLMTVVRGGPYYSYFFVADHRALSDPEHPVLVVDLREQPGRTFRVVPAQMWAVENNLSLANMEFSSFANEADPDGVLRGFRD